MSPEQLQGKDTDARTDLFSFGCVLYEMLTGKHAFEGDSAASVIASILERDPPPLNTTPLLDRLVRRALAKDPDKRFHTARDLKAALTWALDDPAPTAVTPKFKPKHSRRTWMTHAASALAGGAGVWALSRFW